MSLDCQFVVAPSVFSNVYVYGDMILKRPVNFRLCYEIDRGGSEDQKEVWVEWLLHRSDVTSKGWNLHGQVSFNFLRSLLTLMNLLNLKGVLVMVFNATFDNISAISWRSVLLVEETGVPGENHRYWQTLSHNVVSITTTTAPTSLKGKVFNTAHQNKTKYYMHVKLFSYKSIGIHQHGSFTKENICVDDCTPIRPLSSSCGRFKSKTKKVAFFISLLSTQH
jgi:hypothetical protein